MASTPHLHFDSSVDRRASQSDSRWPAERGLFVRMEFGISLAPSKRKAPRSHPPTQIEQNQHRQAHPQSLTPVGPHYGSYYGYYAPVQRQRYQWGQIEARPAPRSTSEPPAIMERGQVQPTYQPYRPSLHHTRSMTSPVRTRQLERKPLPALPSSYRLGEDGLPWTSPFPDRLEQDFAEPTIVEITSQKNRHEDPQREKQLRTLQQAMMTVGTFEDDWRQPWDSSEPVGEIPHTPRLGGVGWAISRSNSTVVSPASHICSPGSPWDSDWDIPHVSEDLRRRSYSR